MIDEEEYNSDDALNRECEEYEELNIFYCDNCSNGILFKELYKQDSDIFDDFIYLCPYCGGWVTI